MIANLFYKIDSLIINFFRAISVPFAKLAVFVIFFWFGLLKVVGESPANPLVKDLLEKTLPFLTFEQFIVCFGVFEMLIGLTFILPKFERVAIFLLAIHMVTTFLPLVMLPEVVWQSSWVPTMEGQYIIKNLAIIGLAMGVAAHLHRRQK